MCQWRAVKVMLGPICVTTYVMIARDCTPRSTLRPVYVHKWQHAGCRVQSADELVACEVASPSQNRTLFRMRYSAVCVCVAWLRLAGYPNFEPNRERRGAKVVVGGVHTQHR